MAGCTKGHIRHENGEKVIERLLILFLSNDWGKDVKCHAAFCCLPARSQFDEIFYHERHLNFSNIFNVNNEATLFLLSKFNCFWITNISFM